MKNLHIENSFNIWRKYDMFVTITDKCNEEYGGYLADKILNCDLSSAYAILDDLFFMRVEPIIILSTITAVYVDMHRVLSGKGHAYQNDKIASDFGYGNRAFTLKDAARNLKNFDFNKLNFSFKALVGADSQLKSFSGNDRVILEELIVKLSYIAAKGESVD